MRTEVLIVGAGPTGLALATTLVRAGVDCMIIDRLEAGQNTSRAAVIHAHTLEVLDSLGVSGQLSKAGLKLTRFCIRDRKQCLIRLDFATLPSRYAQLLMLPQDQTEAILRDALAAAQGRVRWGHSLAGLSEQANHVEATLRSRRGIETVQARFVVGADGMHSGVRQHAGIGFAGGRDAAQFVLADVHMDWPLGREEVSLFFSPAGLLVVAPLTAPRRFRIVATVSTPDASRTIADIQALLDQRGPTGTPTQVNEVLWSSSFAIHHRVAEHYRAGRLFLVGDAAHVHSPAGGQGMNTGLVDACVLGRLLAEQVLGRAGEDTLDDYERLRRPAAVEVLALAGRLTSLATMRAAPARWLRNLALRMIDRLPPAKRKLTMNLSGLSRRAAAGELANQSPGATFAKPSRGVYA